VTRSIYLPDFWVEASSQEYLPDSWVEKSSQECLPDSWAEESDQEYLPDPRAEEGDQAVGEVGAVQHQQCGQEEEEEGVELLNSGYYLMTPLANTSYLMIMRNLPKYQQHAAPALLGFCRPSEAIPCGNHT
jgi:hypothetical protein